MTQRSTFRSLFQRLWNAKQTNCCQYVDANGARCSKSAIKSHTVQRGRVLASIAEQGHVYKIGIPKKPNHPRHRDFEKIGLRKASVFPGFCESHDFSLFNSFETGQGDLAPQELALQGYRCICHETYKKERAERVYSNHELLSALKQQDPRALLQAEKYLEGTRLALRDLERQKKSFENILHEKDMKQLYATVFVLGGKLPLAYSSSFAPEFAFDGKLLLPEQYGDWNSVSVFCGAIKLQTVLAFVGIQDIDGHDLSKFFRTLETLDFQRIGALALHTAIEHAENTFFRPSWIEQLLPEIKDELLFRFGDGVPGEPNSRKKNLAKQFDIVRAPAIRRYNFSPT